MAKRTSKTVRRSKTSVKAKTKTRNISGPFGSSVPLLLTGGLTALGLLGAIYAGTTASVAALPMQAKYCMIAWLAVSVLATVFITPRNFIVGFLLGLFAMLIGWRIAGLHNIAIVIYPLLAAFIAFVVQFFDCLLRDRRLGDKAHLGAADWHLTLLRILIGFSTGYSHPPPADAQMNPSPKCPPIIVAIMK